MTWSEEEEDKRGGRRRHTWWAARWAVTKQSDEPPSCIEIATPPLRCASIFGVAALPSAEMCVRKVATFELATSETWRA